MKKRFPALLPVAFALAFALSPVVRAAEAPARVEGFGYVRTVGDISEYNLESNGLTVLLMPDHSAPVITFQVTYRVGSRNEVTGTTGATHLLEHLMFKGSKSFNRDNNKNVDQVLDPLGGSNNATTWMDRTNYYEIFGNEHLPLVVEMEADRMRGLLLREDDRRPEMTVVRNEFERGENSPFEALEKEIFQSAFVAHPYHHSTIGWRSDIEKVSIEKLREFYDTFYWPNNATVSIVGDFQPAAALALVKKFYGVIPKSPKPIPEMYTEEPEQSGPRRVTVQRAGELGVVAIAHKIPSATHPDAAPLTVASAILASGKNSRLYKALTDQSLSIGVQAAIYPTRDPGLHLTFIPLAPEVPHDKVEKIALDEIEKMKKNGVTENEVKAAIAKNLADSAFQKDGSFAIASKLNENIAIGDWTTFYTFDEALKKVTPKDVQRVLQQYFNADQSTTGYFIPRVAAPDAKPQP